MRMVILTYFILVIFLRNLHSVRVEIIKSKCAFGHLGKKYFSECGNRGYAMRCNDTSLTQIPDSYPMPQNFTKFPPPLCLLDLSYNEFSLVGNQSFVNVKNLNSTDVLWLYLDYSKIKSIASNAFENLTNLLYLNLTGNYLNQRCSFGDGVFKPLLSLRNINVKENRLETFDDIGRELQYLKNLRGIYMDLCADCVFGKNFSKLTNLKTLGLSGRSNKACNAPSIKNITFQYVPTVERLNISSCHIQSIDKNAFSYLKNIKLLDISYNEHLKFTGMNEALYGLRNSSTLKLLNVNRIHQLYEFGIQLKLTDIENLKTLHTLETLHMDLNKIEVFDEKILNPYQFPKTLKDFTLSGNRLTYGKYVEYLSKAIGIESLDLSRQHLNYDPFFRERYENRQMSSKNGMIKDFSKISTEEKFPFNCDIYLPHSLRKIKWRKSFINLKIVTPINICGATGLKYLDVSFNLISKWNAPIFGVEHVTHLDLSENVCDEVNPKFFLRFKSLEHLNLSGNSLGKVFDPDLNPNASKMFKVQKNITKLDLSFNKISSLPWDIFKNLPNLRYLDLSDNSIDEWNFSLENSHCLRRLDVSGNKLYYLPGSLTKYLDSIAMGNCNKNKNVSVNLYSNPIECTCKTLPFLEWMRDSKVVVNFTAKDTCRLNGENQCLEYQHLEQIISILKDDKCLDRSWVTWTISAAGSVFVCLLTVIVCCTMYRNRWKLRYLYYSRNRRYIHEGFERLFENDAFVSYAKNNASFIKNEMVPALETQYGLHLWVADRNSVPGTSVAENICHGIYNSRKSILLINKAYLNDTWCDYEMHMAHTESIETKRKMIMIVLMESIPMDSLPIWLMRLLQSERSLEYPDHRQDINTFWMNLADEIQC
ncbi:toll-like receptor 4 [Mercenaria mercenaria]|uniref:toll-like receptor 4 n=1 Tax=Mercenaria mercenaria TaxID=6596 RepID=UPI00234F57F8|nr:toll-like receptor 4 [Mercenaria mercenaria]